MTNCLISPPPTSPNAAVITTLLCLQCLEESCILLVAHCIKKKCCASSLHIVDKIDSPIFCRTIVYCDRITGVWYNMPWDIFSTSRSHFWSTANIICVIHGSGRLHLPNINRLALMFPNIVVVIHSSNI